MSLPLSTSMLVPPPRPAPARRSFGQGTIHVVIGDTQVKPSVPTAHLRWIGRYIVDKFAGRSNVRLIHLGDHADMPSLSSYDKGKKEFEGRRYKADIRSANRAWDELNEPIARFNEQQRRARRRQWEPLSRDVTLGNHEYRINRACSDSPELDGILTTGDLNFAEHGWRVHAFRKVIWRDGVAYAHYFYHPKTGRPYGGDNITTRLKTIGHTFTMGHQQGIGVGIREVGNGRQHGLVLGSTYLHDEAYLGPQTTRYWRGIVVKYHVRRGEYDPKFVSLESLCQRYERKTLSEYLRGWYRKHGRPESEAA